MSTTEQEPEAPSAPKALMPKLGSLLAFLPLAVWTTWHLYDNMSAWQGAAAWESRVTAARSPVVELFGSALVLIPLVLHTVWGIRRLTIMQPNLGRYPTFDNIKYILQRLSAVGLALFIPAHIFLARINPLLKSGRHETFADISHEMRFHVPTLVVYLLGVLGTCYHLANGLQTGGMTWGFAASPKAMKRMNLVSIGVFLGLLGMGYGTILALYNAGESASHSAATASAAEAPSASH